MQNGEAILLSRFTLTLHLWKQLEIVGINEIHGETTTFLPRAKNTRRVDGERL